MIKSQFVLITYFPSENGLNIFYNGEEWMGFHIDSYDNYYLKLFTSSLSSFYKYGIDMRWSF